MVSSHGPVRRIPPTLGSFRVYPHVPPVHGQRACEGAAARLAEQRDPRTPRFEEHLLRLESDEKAVKIVTIHKSKGLEYPVVFCPFGWEGSQVRGTEFTFHDIDDDRRLTLDLGSESTDRHLALAQKELLSENLRLLYVALTRAKQLCYLAWGRISTAETSSLAYNICFIAMIRRRLLLRPKI